MQHTDKALAELLRLLETNSPEAMAWLMDVGYRQAHVTGWLFIGFAIVGIMLLVGGMWSVVKANKMEDAGNTSDEVTGWGICGILGILLGLMLGLGFGYTGIVRLINPGYFVYQMLKDLLPGQ